MQSPLLDTLKHTKSYLASHLIVRGQPSVLFEWTDRISPQFLRKPLPLSNILGFSSVVGVESTTSYCMARNGGIDVYMGDLLERGARLEGAFMHWYERVDPGFRDVYEEGAECLQNVVDAYRDC
jgi:hypothetical protein